VWAVVIAYMERSAEMGLDRDEVLRFIFGLSFLQLGQDYPVQVCLLSVVFLSICLSFSPSICPSITARLSVV
jgi:hypothetical protein